MDWGERNVKVSENDSNYDFDISSFYENIFVIMPSICDEWK